MNKFIYIIQGEKEVSNQIRVALVMILKDHNEEKMLFRNDGFQYRSTLEKENRVKHSKTPIFRSITLKY